VSFNSIARREDPYSLGDMGGEMGGEKALRAHVERASGAKSDSLSCSEDTSLGEGEAGIAARRRSRSSCLFSKPDFLSMRSSTIVVPSFMEARTSTALHAKRFREILVIISRHSGHLLIRLSNKLPRQS
jgi:hypothetical protein